MRRVAPLALALLLLAGCGVQPTAPAQTTRATALRAKSDAGLRAGVIKLREQRFKKLDQNFNGEITRDEATDSALRLPGIVEGFDDYDTDHNNAITKTEFIREDVIRYFAGELRPRIQEMFFKVDANRDFKLTGAELDKIKLYFSLFPETHGADLDQNGEVPYTEFEDAYMITLPAVQPQGPESQQLAKLPAVK